MTELKEREYANIGSVPGDPEYQVSELSFWRHSVWRFVENRLHNTITSIGWDFPLPDGTMSSDAVNSRLLLQFQLVAWACVEGDGFTASQQTWANFTRIATGMRELFRWMNWKGHTDLVALGASDFDDYIESLSEIIVQGFDFYNDCYYGNLANTGVVEVENAGEDLSDAVDEIDQEQALNGCEEDEGITYGMVVNRIQFLDWIYLAAKSLANAGVPGVNFHPLGAFTVRVRAKAIAPLVLSRTPPLPDEVALPLLSQSLLWLNSKSADVCALVESYLGLGSKSNSESIERLKRERRELILNWNFSVLPGESAPWTSVDLKNTVPSYGEEMVSVGPLLFLRRMVYALRDACVIVLLYFTGMRFGEIGSLQYHKQEEAAYPECISLRKDRSGLIELFFVSALLSKGRTVPERREWIIGCRPVGSLDVPPAVRAIMMLSKMVGIWAPGAESFPLFFRFSGIKSIGDEDLGIEPARISLMKRGMNLFIREYVDLSSLPDTSSRGENLVIYRESAGGCIRAVHGRKTFAAYILETRTSLLLPLSRHFKHMSTAITEASYFPAVNRLRQESETERYTATINFFMEAVVSERAERAPLLGKMAPLLKKWLGEIDVSDQKDLGKIASRVRNMVEIHDMRIFFSDHGNCFIRAHPEESKCWGDGERSPWLIDRPNFARRSPSDCAGCKLLQLDASHIPFWRSRVQSLLPEGINERAGEYRVLLARKAQAQSILDILERKAVKL